MIDLKTFRKNNNLTQDELGQFLGIKKSHISRIEHGHTSLSVDKVEKLFNNPYGWDTSILNNETQPNKTSSASDHIDADIEVATLRKENEMLRQQLSELKERSDRYWQMIEKLTNNQ